MLSDLTFMRLLPFCFMLTVHYAQAAPLRPLADTTIAADAPPRQLMFSYAYMNPVSYRGRTFGVHQWGMMPQLAYQSPTGWTVYGVGYVWNDFRTSSRLGKVDIGVEKEGALGRHFAYTLGYERWFFPDLDKNETAPLSNFTEAYLSGEWNNWTPAIGIYYMFASAQLLQTDLEVNRYVGLLEGPSWSLFAEPLLKATFANQSLIVNGLFQLPVDIRRHSAPTDSRPFGLVAAEVNVPVTLQTSRYRFTADPRVAQPYNTLPGERQRLFFYFVGTLTYTMKLK